VALCNLIRTMKIQFELLQFDSRLMQFDLALANLVHLLAPFRVELLHSCVVVDTVSCFDFNHVLCIAVTVCNWCVTPSRGE